MAMLDPSDEEEEEVEGMGRVKPINISLLTFRSSGSVLYCKQSTRTGGGMKGEPKRNGHGCGAQSIAR